mmetsp:Transcript_42948/g.128922  ORF Transcript_42948/g.128922 Transcript_42948/m.128922 type:complete len:175 (+) Transcript_42948:177-701(+)
MNAWLYTGSQALQTERILIFEPEGSQLRRAGTGTYAAMLVGLKRRFNNLWVDEDRQVQMDVFLGLKQDAYFQRVPLTYRASNTRLADHEDSDDEGDAVGRMHWRGPSSVSRHHHTAGGAESEPTTPPATPSNGANPGGEPSSDAARRTTSNKDLFGLNRDLISQVNNMFRVWGK